MSLYAVCRAAGLLDSADLAPLSNWLHYCPYCPLTSGDSFAIVKLRTETYNAGAATVKVNYYYSTSYAADATDQDLIHMCRTCAADAPVQWASRGDEDAECEYCGASNDEAHSLVLDAQFTAITGQPAPARPGARSC